MINLAIQIGFFKKFIKKTSSVNFAASLLDENGREEIQFNTLLYDMIFNDGNLVSFNIEQNEFLEYSKKNEYFMAILKQSQQSATKLKFDNEEWSLLSSNEEYCQSKKPQTLLFHDESSRLLDWKQLGLLNYIYGKELVDLEFSMSYRIDIVKDELGNFERLELGKSPTSDVIIVDPFFCDDAKEKSILINKLFMNSPSNKKLSLVIILSMEKKFRQLEESERLKKLKNFKSILSKRISPEIRLEILDKKNLFEEQGNLHDRFILTNYYYILSPHGFDIYKNGKRKNKTTNIYINGITSSKSHKKKYFDLLNQIDSFYINDDNKNISPLLG